MSVLSQVYAVPVRIGAVFNLLLHSQDCTEEREKVENVLSPINLRTKKGEKGEMVKKVIDECVSMGLVQQVDKGEKKMVSLSKTIVASYGKQEFDKERFRDFLTRSIISGKENNTNEDLCSFLAWYLAQDIYTMQGDWDWMNKKLEDTFGTGRMGFTQKTRWEQFQYWATYLGFAWKCGDNMFPDPTHYISHQLMNLSKKLPKLAPIGQFLTELAAACPVFRGGGHYRNIQKHLTATPPNVVCSTVSNTLIRLDEGKQIALTYAKADAKPWLLRVSSGETAAYDHIEIR